MSEPQRSSALAKPSPVAARGSLIHLFSGEIERGGRAEGRERKGKQRKKRDGKDEGRRESLFFILCLHLDTQGSRRRRRRRKQQPLHKENLARLVRLSRTFVAKTTLCWEAGIPFLAPPGAAAVGILPSPANPFACTQNLYRGSRLISPSPRKTEFLLLIP